MKEGTLPTLDAPAVLVFDTERLFTDAFSENYNPEPRSCFPYLEKVKPRVFLELQWQLTRSVIALKHLVTMVFLYGLATMMVWAFSLIG